MALRENGHWHNANGSGLAFRPPPTVSEAAMYSPFTSIIPFSADVIPFPSAEPPTPPSSLTSDQQNAAKRAIGILNDEIKEHSTAQHLNDTLLKLQRLLRSDNLPEYNFKQMPQLATPPESPEKDANKTTPSYVPTLSPFASTLLRHTNVSFAAFGDTPLKRPRQLGTPAQAPSPHDRSTPQTQIATPNGNAYAYNGQLTLPSGVPSPPPRSTPTRPGPAVMIKPISSRREEFTKYDSINSAQSLSQEIKEQHRSDAANSVLKPHEREIADRKTEELRSFVASLSSDRDDVDGSDHFITVSTHEGDMTVMKRRYMDTLSEKMSSLIHLGRFAALPVALVVEAQSLLQPGIASVTKSGSISFGETTVWLESVHAATAALKASKMVLDTMIEGRDDHRVRREDVIDIMIDLIKFIKDQCIFPIVQAHKSGVDDVGKEAFMAASEQKKEWQAVLRLCGGVISRFAVLIGKHNLSDRALNSIEYLALEFVMQQNSDSERDSVFTIQKFEQFRQKAVDVLAELFARHDEQQDSILRGILSNLEKLPDKKASARHFKSAREMPIMTISALFMRFVQMTATNRETSARKSGIRVEDASEDEESDYEPRNATEKSQNRTDRPGENAEKLFKKAQLIAFRIASSLVDRASNVSKAGDKPFRNLLDLFIEDFCNVLGSPEWPAAEMLLQQLVLRMTHILQAEKQSVVDKDMALSVLARVGCGILDLKLRLRKMKREQLDVSQSDISSKLDRYLDDVMSEDMKERINDLDLYAFEGPYRMVLESLPEYLELPPTHDDPRLRSVSGCHITSWLAAVTKAFPVGAADSDACSPVVHDLRKRLVSMFVDPAWLAQKYKFQPVSEVQSKIAAGIITLQNPLGRYLAHIVNKMLEKLQDKTSSKLRARGMAGLEHLVQKDPKVMTQGNVNSMIACFVDASPMVRESTLSLVSTCLEHQPVLLPHFFPHILRLANDVSNGPKRKAIKLLKDIYRGQSSAENKLSIIIALLPASQDDEKMVCELARSVLGEILLSSTKSAARADESQLKLDRTMRSKLIIDTTQAIRGDPKRLEAFERFFVHALKHESTSDDTNVDVCRTFVADMIDEVISPTSGSDTSAQARIMTALSMFAKVRPTLFTFDQVQLLKLYIKTVTSLDDLELVKPTAVIFRYVFPTLKSLQPKFAEGVQSSLMANISKLANWAIKSDVSHATLLDVAHCLWIICPNVEGGMTKLISVISAVLCQLRPLAMCPKQEAMAQRIKLESYLILLGTFGQVCDFDQFKDELVAKVKDLVPKVTRNNPSAAQALAFFSKTKASPSVMLLETVRPFTAHTWDMDIRVQALRSVGAIWRGTPSLFERDEIVKVYKHVFVNADESALRRVALDALEAYCNFAERRSETGAAIAVGQGAVTGNARLESSYGVTSDDKALSLISSNYLEDFKKNAMGNDNNLVVPATRTIASISRQGTIDPQQCIATFVVLSTSSNDVVAQTAAVELKRISEKTDAILEKEYMESVRMAYEYQTSVCGDPHGMREATFSAKLIRLFEALKDTRKAVLRQFIANLCRLVEFNFSKLDSMGDMPESVLFARFCLENIALVDFALLDDVARCLRALESIMLKTTGPEVGVAIETEMPKRFVTVQQPPVVSDFQQQLGPAAGHEGSMSTSQLEQPNISDARLRHITSACMILKMVWGTRDFIRRCYNLQKLKGGIPQKDFARPAQRNNLVSGKDLWESFVPIMSALRDRDSMLKTCYDFADILDFDMENQIGDDGNDDNAGAGYETPNEGEHMMPYPTSGRGRKRKSNINPGNTPKRPRGRPAGAKNKKRSSRTPDIDGDSD
ncbi:sister chromatid cohesion C-terminus-domain-containing protein [Ampelomyces quisqualis]|uniref:Sister chromatid cohesion protein n=1 Tax=Ampelomyces quisqualis TaxID=50730 RepID=A0A6A5R0E5_AMPQU|nr:sister chromatid cohesion C-terminus-domain-containing protein [Ampelomyces quisqualis]